MKKVLFALLVLVAVAGCSKKEKCTYNACERVAPASEIQAVKDYLASQNITATQHCSGLFYIVDAEGTGTKPTACSTVAVNYEGKLTNGNTFEKTTSPATFDLSGLIPGFTNGIPLIKSGGRIRLYIPPALAYGSRAQGGIPANSILIFDVSLVGVQ